MTLFVAVVKGECGHLILLLLLLLIYSQNLALTSSLGGHLSLLAKRVRHFFLRPGNVSRMPSCLVHDM